MGPGMSTDVSDQLLELGQAIDNELIAVDLPRTADNTIGTTIAGFANFFAQVYESS